MSAQLLEEIEQQKDEVIFALKQELEQMEGKAMDLGNGTENYKYNLLNEFIASATEESFCEAYARLSDVDKHAIISLLDEQAANKGVVYGFIDRLSHKLYGTEKDKNGNEVLALKRQYELENDLQNICF